MGIKKYQTGISKLYKEELSVQSIYKGDDLIYEKKRKPGLYETDTSTLIYSWQELIENNYIYVYNGEMSYSNNASANLAGDLIISDEITKIGYRAFFWCQELTQVVIPCSVNEIGESAFTYCRKLTHLDIPNSVTRIGDSAFDSCTFTSIILPKNLSSIGSEPFAYCHNLMSINIDSSNSIFETIDNNRILVEKATKRIIAACGSPTIPEDIKIIGTSAFTSSNISTIIIPTSVISIGNYAFRNITSLKSVKLLSSVPPQGGEQMFEWTSSTINVPNSAVSIYKDAQYWSVYADKIVGY